MPTPLTQEEKQKFHTPGGQHVCPYCNHVGPDEEFTTPKRRKNGDIYYGQCKTCHREGARASRYKLLYNITVEEYERILAFQDGKCAICQKSAEAGKHKLAVDHCHISGLIRGLLCWRCNKALGCFEDDQWRMFMAFLYIFAPPAVKVLGEKRYGLLGRIKKKAKNRVYGNADLDEVFPMNLDSFLSTLQDMAREKKDAAAKERELRKIKARNAKKKLSSK
jgi:hypothetical protein